ncbi:secreted protein [methanotrophic bacterial endosymbiont of Bathymodiolus sp.]|nr:secreted protein [methanotrophic bacterial endosymbiont of Bathymodiolus sp.]
MSFVLSILIMLGINQVLFAETEQTDTLQVTIEGRDVTADWSLMPEAERYTLYYAYADYKGC